jgi:hypothetical protein
VWDVNVPGFLEGDTVAHCGGDLSGQFVWTLTATDICTQWTEIRPVWHKGALAVIGAIEDMYQALARNQKFSTENQNVRHVA